jgi:hypothetical protein
VLNCKASNGTRAGLKVGLARHLLAVPTCKVHYDTAEITGNMMLVNQVSRYEMISLKLSATGHEH